MPPTLVRTDTAPGAAATDLGWHVLRAAILLAVRCLPTVALAGDAISGADTAWILTSTAALTWMAIEWLKHGKPSVLGLATGAIAGLAAVTPASGFIGPVGGFGIGLVAGVICFLCSTALKSKLGYDDSLDVFGVHGVGGFVGR